MGNGREYGKRMSFAYVSGSAAAMSRLLWHLSYQNINFVLGNVDFLYDHARFMQNICSQNLLNSCHWTHDCVVRTYVPKLVRITTRHKWQFSIFFSNKNKRYTYGIFKLIKWLNDVYDPLHCFFNANWGKCNNCWLKLCAVVLLTKCFLHALL